MVFLGGRPSTDALRQCWRKFAANPKTPRVFYLTACCPSQHERTLRKPTLCNQRGKTIALVVMSTRLNCFLRLTVRWEGIVLLRH